MANRKFYPSRGSLSREIVKLYGSMTIGSSGAVASSEGKGFTIAKTATKTGRYTITLDDAFTAFKGCNCVVAGVTDAALTVLYGGVRNVDVSAAGKTLDIQFVGAVATDANPASGDVVYIELILQNGSDV